jgi:nifR3 family TIM-barrel protein
MSDLSIGQLKVWPPVVLAPMAGVTNYPFRAMCRAYGAGLCVSEMVTARPLVDRREKTLRIAEFGPDEHPRSLQLYGVDPIIVGEAVKRLVSDGLVDHVDMNFGCPVRKVTRQGGGAALPAKPKLLAAIIRSAVGNAGATPVTVKFRLGIDDERLYYLETGAIAESEGCRAVGLHARTAEQLYDGAARWEHIAELKARLKIPVLGNGDIWEASDALRMIEETGCDGVIVGRGCLGRPWLFRDLWRAFAGEPELPAPNLGEVAAVMWEHAERLSRFMGEGPAMRAFRRHATWYTKGFRGSALFRQRSSQIESLLELEALLATLDPLEPFPASALRVPRGKGSGTQSVSLPQGFLDDPDNESAPPDDEAVDGG